MLDRWQAERDLRDALKIPIAQRLDLLRLIAPDEVEEGPRHDDCDESDGSVYVGRDAEWDALGDERESKEALAWTGDEDLCNNDAETRKLWKRSAMQIAPFELAEAGLPCMHTCTSSRSAVALRIEGSGHMQSP